MKSSVNTFINQRKHLFCQINFINIKLFMVIILIFTFVCLPFTKSYSQNAVKGAVNIVNSPKGDMEPEPKPSSHKQFDVEIFKINFDEPFMGKGSQIYSIRYYMIGHNDSLNYQKAWFGTDDNFDKATYQWTNDSTVAVIMYNSLTAIADTLELFSIKGGSGIRINGDIKFK